MKFLKRSKENETDDDLDVIKQTNGKTKKLSTRLATVIGIALTVIFVIFIAVTVKLTSSALGASLNNQFTNLSQKNAAEAQSIFNDCTTLGENIEAYIVDMYAIYDQQMADGTMNMNRVKGVLYEEPILPINVEIEKFLANLIKATVANNDAIIGAGVYFEPYQFDDQIRDYSLYYSVDDIDNPKSFGAYESYSQENYYKTAKETEKVYFTEPFEYEGKWIISASFPIIADNMVYGVTAVDIDLTMFNKLASESEYETLFNKILTSDLNLIFDSSDI